MELCLMLGCTLVELGQRMDGKEFDAWCRRYWRKPWGDKRHEIHSAIVATTVANYAGRMRKDGDPARPADYMPFQNEKPAEKPQEPDPIAFHKRLGL